MDNHLTATAFRTVTELESAARRVMSALEEATTTDIRQARDAERQLVRLRFALARVDELTQRVSARASVFESARLDVALSILDAHVARAEDFCDPAAWRRRRRATRPVVAGVAEEEIAAPGLAAARAA